VTGRQAQIAHQIAQLKAGDTTAFDAVYERFRPRLFSFVVRLSGERALAEDLVQETFMKLARHAPRLADDTRIGAWLFTVARNLFISHRRWALLDVARVSELRLWTQLAESQATPFAVAAASETERLIEQAIASLPLAYREVLLLVTVDDMAPSEAATIIGLKPAAVRQRLARARAMIRAYLDEAGAPGASRSSPQTGSQSDER
jgi:RNA polymerase sigma-70 factor (ECF subfamily)